ncbi:MAG: class I SAM-dependent methyltransferase [Leptonema illini]|jgi:SAM-dependent methyltransferase|uniref:Class I SAM-dependent methyltransferase n=1 Tax=Leptonema illini TaxID=183 RepID=A0A833LXU7_9LEPT|nr:MAG: class I SAM-dependent methyltransferase [Leptonema illini]
MKQKKITSWKGFKLYAPDVAFENEGFDPRSFELLYAKEGKNFWFRARNDIIEWFLKRYTARTGDYFEIGCGTGFVLEMVRRSIPGLHCSASDIHVEGLIRAQDRNPDAILFQLDARRIPFRERFDTIGMYDVLEHIEEDLNVLKEVCKALKPGGSLLLTVPQHMFLWGPADVFAYHKRRYTRKELVHKIEQAGFQVQRVSSFVTFLLPLMFLSRFTNRKRYDPEAEFRLPALVNQLFYLMMRFERALIIMGLSLPAGGSLILLAQKKQEFNPPSP